jgi:hypothetical protein
MLSLAQALVKSPSRRVFKANPLRRDYRCVLVYYWLAGGAMHRALRKPCQTRIQTPALDRHTTNRLSRIDLC